LGGDANSHQIVEFVNSSVATTERRLGGLLQEALSTSQAEFEAAVVEHTDRRTSEIEGRLQEMLLTAQAKLEATTKSALDQQFSSIGAQLSCSTTRTEASLQYHLSQLNGENERPLQSAIERVENIAVNAAKAHAEEQAASGKKRLYLALCGASKEQSNSLDMKLQQAISEIKTETETRTSVWAEVQGEAIEERLQQKLDEALEGHDWSIVISWIQPFKVQPLHLIGDSRSSSEIWNPNKRHMQNGWRRACSKCCVRPKSHLKRQLLRWRKQLVMLRCSHKCTTSKLTIASTA